MGSVAEEDMQQEGLHKQQEGTAAEEGRLLAAVGDTVLAAPAPAAEGDKVAVEVVPAAAAPGVGKMQLEVEPPAGVGKVQLEVELMLKKRKKSNA